MSPLNHFSQLRMTEDASNRIEIPAQQIRPIINKILSGTNIFRNTGYEIVRQCLQNIRNVPANTTIIQDGEDQACAFYILLRGELKVYKGRNVVANIQWLHTVGEIGFLSHRREATVVTSTECHLAVVTQGLVNSFPQEVQSTLYLNLARELGEKLAQTNCERQFAFRK